MISRRQFTKLACSAAALAAAEPAFATNATKPNKRGCCFTTNKNDKWRNYVDQLKPSWMYSWGPRRPKELSPEIDFTPMIWGDGADDIRSRVLSDIAQRAEAGEVNHLLGFNEPDQANQSDMPVERVVELWPQLMEVGVPLISPGCVHPDREWMRTFMNQVEQRNLRVDALAVHSYGGPSVEHLVKRLEGVHKEFGRPLWITEFAVGDWEAKSRGENRFKPERIASFMQEILPALDSLDFVERYAWFSASPSSGPLGTSSLFNKSGSLSRLGKIYAA